MHSGRLLRRTIATLLASSALSAGVAACSSSTSGSAAERDASSADAGVSTDEAAAVETCGESSTVDQRLTSLANELFDFDPTIDPKTAPAANATAIGKNAQANLGGSCGTVEVTGTTVTIAFGAAPGCTLPNGLVVSGTVDLAVSKSGSTTTVAMTLTSVVVSGEAIAGTASFATTTGTTFSVKTDLTSGTKTDVATLSVAGASGSFTITGTATVTSAGVTSTLTFTGLEVKDGECYAEAGTVEVMKGGVSETITFSSETPETGKVVITTGKHTSTTTLPPYGSCPSATGSSHIDAGTRHDTGATRDAGATSHDAGRDSAHR